MMSYGVGTVGGIFGFDRFLKPDSVTEENVSVG